MNAKCWWVRLTWQWFRDETRPLPGAVQRHFHRCSACAEYVAQYEDLDRRLALPQTKAAVPDAWWAQLERELRRPEYEAGESVSRYPAWRVGVVVAAAVLVVVMVSARLGMDRLDHPRGASGGSQEELATSPDLSWMYTALALADIVGEWVESPDFGLRQLVWSASRHWLPWVPEGRQSPMDVGPATSRL